MINTLKDNIKNILIAALIGFSAAAAIYFYFIQTWIISKRQIFTAAVLAAVLAVLFFALLWLWERFVLKHLDAKTIRWLALLSFTLGILLSISIVPRQENLFLLPKQSITIQVEANPNTNGTKVIFSGMGQARGDASYKQMSGTENWERDGARLILKVSPPAELLWQGKPGESIDFQFEQGPAMGMVTIDWGDGLPESVVDLYQENETDPVTIFHDYEVPWVSAMSIWLLAGVPLAFALFLLFTAWMIWQPAAAEKSIHWLWYAIPALLVWSFTLLVYWPGILTPDSLSHWYQIHSGNYNDWHSVFYSVTMWLLTRLVDHPAIVAFAQIIFLSLSFAWGLGELQKWGVKPVYLWSIAGINALAFQNAATVISLWKDVPYSICLLLVFILSLKVVRSKGEWLLSRANLIGAIAIMTGLLLFRKNGLFVFIGVLVLWAIIYRKTWKKALIVLVISMVLSQGFNALSTPLLNVQVNSGKGISILLHHIIAHVDNETPMTAVQEAHLDQILPLEDWVYKCSTVDTVIWNKDVNLHYYQTHLDETTAIFFDTLKADPMVNIRHQICASEVVWRLLPTDASYTNNFSHRGGDDIFTWITDNDFGIDEAYLMPGASYALTTYYYWTIEHTIPYVLSWRPAFYLYFSLLGIGLFVWKWGKREVLLLAAPILLQSGTLMAINLAQDFRYQFGVVLITFLSLGLWVLKPKDVQD